MRPEPSVGGGRRDIERGFNGRGELRRRGVGRNEALDVRRRRRRASNWDSWGQTRDTLTRRVQRLHGLRLDDKALDVRPIGQAPWFEVRRGLYGIDRGLWQITTRTASRTEQFSCSQGCMRSTQKFNRNRSNEAGRRARSLSRGTATRQLLFYHIHDSVFMLASHVLYEFTAGRTMQTPLAQWRKSALRVLRDVPEDRFQSDAVCLRQVRTLNRPDV